MREASVGGKDTFPSKGYQNLEGKHTSSWSCLFWFSSCLPPICPRNLLEFLPQIPPTKSPNPSRSQDKSLHKTSKTTLRGESFLQHRYMLYCEGQSSPLHTVKSFGGVGDVFFRKARPICKVFMVSSLSQALIKNLIKKLTKHMFKNLANNLVKHMAKNVLEKWFGPKHGVILLSQSNSRTVVLVPAEPAQL